MEIVFPRHRIKKRYDLDISTMILLFSNAIVIFIAIYEKWDVGILMWIYWIQSIIIGFYNLIKILTLKNFTTEGLAINDRPAPPSTKTQLLMGFFFILHYGGYHFIYLIFLLFLCRIGWEFWKEILVCSIIFFINHSISFFYNLPKERYKQQNIGRVFGSPYIRIVPMHLTIVLGGVFVKSLFTLVLFLVIKTITDLIMHVVEHAKDMEEGLDYNSS